MGPQLGTWFCRGYFINTVDRSDPHIMSHQDFLFFDGSDPALHSKDAFYTNGPEGTDEPGDRLHRAVTGGTGRYFGVTGQTVHWSTGTNTTMAGLVARFEVDLLHP